MNIIEKAIGLQNAARKADSPGTSAARRRQAPKLAPQPGGAAGAPANFARLVELGMLPHPERDQMLMEQLRHLKRPILQNAFGPLADGVANVVMVTSARPGAGKSFVSAGLAHALTRARELSVVMIDLDNIKATLTRNLELTDRVGFFDAAEQPDITLESTLVPTEIPGLRVIPTGRQTTESSELLNTQRVRTMVRELAEDDPTRIIILDTPPLLSTPDAHAIVEMANQFVVVVEAGVTKESEMKQVLEALRGDKPVGLVLNKAIGGLAPLYGGDYYYAGAHDRS